MDSFCAPANVSDVFSQLPCDESESWSEAGQIAFLRTTKGLASRHPTMVAEWTVECLSAEASSLWLRIDVGGESRRAFSDGHWMPR
jgi:hypothetical protein